MKAAFELPVLAKTAARGFLGSRARPPPGPRAKTPAAKVTQDVGGEDEPEG
jgi:hypothetical protein